MKKNLIYAAFAAAALFASCNKELTEPVSPAAPKVGEQTFTAVREDFLNNETKATFDGTCIGWELKDSIIVTDGTDSAKFYVTAVDGKVATFTIEEGAKPLATSGVTYKAFYPCRIADGEMPQQQANANGTGPDINHTPSIYSANPMYAESTTNTLEFKNLCGLLAINLSVPVASGDIAFRQVIVQTKNTPLYGPYTITDGKLAYTSPSDGTCRRAASYNTNAKYVSVVKTYYFAIPEGSYDNLEIVPITNLNYTQVFKLKSGSTLIIERNKAYTLNVYADNLFYYLPDYQRHGTTETANCYNIKANSGKCGFPAIKGNSGEAISGIDHVGILWRAQTSGTASDLTGKIIKDATYDNGMIYFTSVNNSGNAVIAAYDNADNILWSWHIWSTASLIGTQTYPNGKTYLDRNLGSLQAEPNDSGALTDGTGRYYTSIQGAGLLYQWGRKDPFTGRCDQSSNKTIAYGTEGTAKTISTTGTVDIATSVAHPTVYYASSAGNWCSEEATWDGATKSLYDPCPVGYRVWANDAWGESPNKTDFEIDKRKANAGGTVALMGARYLTYAFYATNGQLNNKTGAFSAGMTQYRAWFRNVSDSKIGFYNVTFSGTSPNFTISGFSLAKMTIASASAYGMGVRCERIEE